VPCLVSLARYFVLPTFVVLARASANIYRALDHEILDLVVLTHLLKSYKQVHHVEVKITISRRLDCSPRGQRFYTANPVGGG
jgi:hypothetical protein